MLVICSLIKAISPEMNLSVIAGLFLSKKYKYDSNISTNKYKLAVEDAVHASASLSDLWRHSRTL
jgi:hypothetical protein